MLRPIAPARSSQRWPSLARAAIPEPSPETHVDPGCALVVDPRIHPLSRGAALSWSGEASDAGGDQLSGLLDVAGGGPSPEGEPQRCEGAFGRLAHRGQHG